MKTAIAAFTPPTNITALVHLWTHQEPYSKSQRITDSNGAIVAAIELEPFGLETDRSWDNRPRREWFGRGDVQALQPLE